jgi:hypothetical protein
MKSHVPTVARRERELSERRLSDARDLKRTFDEMIVQNHVTELISSLVAGKRSKG